MSSVLFLGEGGQFFFEKDFTEHPFDRQAFLFSDKRDFPQITSSHFCVTDLSMLMIFVTDIEDSLQNVLSSYLNSEFT